MKLLSTFLFTALLGTQLWAADVSIDLKALRQHGLQELANSFGSAPILEDKGIWYIDGASSLELLPFFDHSGLELRLKLHPDAIPYPDLYTIYHAGLNGLPRIMYARPMGGGYDIYFNSDTTVVVLKPRTPPSQIQTLFVTLKKQFPATAVTYLEQIQSLLLRSPNANEHNRVFRFMKKEPIAQNVDLDAYTYRLPYHFEPSRYLDQGKTSKVVNVDSLRSFTAEILKQGGCFASLTSLPAPFGKGWTPNQSCPTRRLRQFVDFRSRLTSALPGTQKGSLSKNWTME